MSIVKKYLKTIIVILLMFFILNSSFLNSKVNTSFNNLSLTQAQSSENLSSNPNLNQEAMVTSATNVEIDEEDFFKIYKENEAFEIGSGTSNTNLSAMGLISAIKITGLKLSENSLKLNEIALVDLGNQNVDFQVSYIRAFNTSINAQKVSYDFAKIKNINDQDLDTRLEINNVEAPIVTEINLYLDVPTILKDIQIAFDASENNAWNKIGSLQFLTTEGNVYRQEEISLDEHQISNQNNGSEYNFSLISAASSFDKFSKSIEENTNDIFMWSYERDIATTNNISIYFGTTELERSLTPLLNSNAQVILYNKDKQLIKRIELAGHASVEQKFAFLQVIDDDKFWSTILLRMGFPIENKDSLVPANFFNYNLKIKPNEGIDHDNLALWNLEIIFDGLGNTLDANSFKNLEFLGLLTNIYTINFSARTNNLTDFNYSLRIDDLNWMSSLTNLSKIAFKGLDGPETSLYNNSLRVHGNALKWTFLKDLSLKLVDFTAFKPLALEDQMQLLNSLVSIQNNWIPLLSFGFTIYLSSNNIGDSLNGKIKEIFDVNVDNPNYIILSKITTISYPEPELFKNENNKYEFTTINVNNKVINATILGGKFYWNFGSTIKPSDITKSTIDGKYYFTTDDPHIGFSDEEIIKVLPKKNYENQPILNWKIDTSELLVNTNSYLLNQSISVDNEIFLPKIFDGNIFWDFDLTIIKYGYRDFNDGHKYYFTSLTKLIDFIGLENFELKQVFEISTDDTANFYYKQYNDLSDFEKQVLDVDLEKIDNGIWVNDKKYKEWIIDDGYVVWDFEDELEIEDIKFKNNENHFFTDFLDEQNNVISNLTSVIPHPPYEFKITKAPPLKDFGMITNLDDINKTIWIDDKEIGVVLREGELYWDYNDISNIKYQLYDASLNNNTGGYKYYTSFVNIPNNSPGEVNFKNITSIEKPKARIIPPPDFFPILYMQASYIEIDNVIYNSIFVFDKWYWNIPTQILENVKYSDNNNKFYTKLTLTNFRNYGMTDVILPSMDQLVADTSGLNIHFPFKLDASNYINVNTGYKMDNEAREYLVIENNVFFLNDDWKKTNFIFIGANKEFELFSSLSKVPLEKMNSLFSKSLFKFTESEKSAQIIAPPKDSNSSLSIYNSEGEVETIYVTIIDNKYYYDDIGALSRVKYVNNDGIYFESILPGKIGTSLTSVDLYNSQLNQIAGWKSDVYSPRLKEKKQISMVILYAASGSIALAGILIVVTRMFFRRK